MWRNRRRGRRKKAMCRKLKVVSPLFLVSFCLFRKIYMDSNFREKKIYRFNKTCDMIRRNNKKNKYILVYLCYYCLLLAA